MGDPINPTQFDVCDPDTARQGIFTTYGMSSPLEGIPVGIETSDGMEFSFFVDTTGDPIGAEAYQYFAQKFQVTERGRMLWNNYRIALAQTERHSLNQSTPTTPTPQQKISPPKKSTPIHQPPPKNMAEDPDAVPDRAESRDVGPFHVDEEYFGDGSLKTTVFDNSLPGYSSSVGHVIPPEKVEQYRSDPEKMTSQCIPLEQGGQLCLDILEATETTHFRFYDASGYLWQLGVSGGIRTPEELIKYYSTK